MFCCDSCSRVGGNHQQHSDWHWFRAYHALCGDGEAVPIHPVVQRWIYGKDFTQCKPRFLQKFKFTSAVCVSQNGKGELQFSSLTFADSGMYQCVAENYWGIKYANAELRVIGENTELRRNLFFFFFLNCWQQLFFFQLSLLHLSLTLWRSSSSGPETDVWWSSANPELPPDRSLRGWRAKSCSSTIPGQSNSHLLKQQLLSAWLNRCYLHLAFPSCLMGAWRSSMPPRTTRASTHASLRTAEGRPTVLATSPSQVRGCMSLLECWCFTITIISKMQKCLSIRGYWDYRSSWRLWGEGWWWDGSEVRGVVRPHAGHHIYLGYRLQGHWLWLGVAALWTSLGRVILNSYSSTLLSKFSFSEKAVSPSLNLFLIS